MAWVHPGYDAASSAGVSPKSLGDRINLRALQQNAGSSNIIPS